MSRELQPGRLLIVQYECRCNQLAVLLSIDTRSKEKLFKVLILTDSTSEGVLKSAPANAQEVLAHQLYGISKLERGLYHPPSKVTHSPLLKGK